MLTGPRAKTGCTPHRNILYPRAALMSQMQLASALSAPLAVPLQHAADSKGAAAASPFAYAPFKYGACTAPCSDAPPTKELNCTQEVCSVQCAAVLSANACTVSKQQIPLRGLTSGKCCSGISQMNDSKAQSSQPVMGRAAGAAGQLQQRRLPARERVAPGGLLRAELRPLQVNPSPLQMPYC